MINNRPLILKGNINIKNIDEYERILRRCANRDSVPQFFDGIYDSTCSYYNGRMEISNQDFLGIVLDYDDKNNIVTLEQRNYFKKGDNVEFFGPNTDTFTYTIDEIIDEDGNSIDIVRHPKQIVKFKVNNNLSKFDFMKIRK